MTDSEYDKAGDFYLNWLDRNVPDRDRRIQSSVEIMLAMLDDVQGTGYVTWDAVKGTCLASWPVEGLSSRVLTFRGYCCGMRRSILTITASGMSWTMRNR